MLGETTGGTGMCAMDAADGADEIVAVAGCENVVVGAGCVVAGAECGVGSGTETVVVTGAVTGVGTAADAAADFDSGPSLRVMPTPVRSVLRTCSRDTGFVRTRLAPRRNAFGTPALPSTIAMAIAVLLSADARALLNTCVAVWTLSQSTMSRSKRCVPNRFSVKGASLECSKLMSSSSRIWVMA